MTISLYPALVISIKQEIDISLLAANPIQLGSDEPVPDGAGDSFLWKLCACLQLLSEAVGALQLCLSGKCFWYDIPW